MQYGPELADHTITMLLVFVFCLMQPFIPLIGLIYFVCNYFYARYDLLYSKREAFQSGGLFWPVVRLLNLFVTTHSVCSNYNRVVLMYQNVHLRRMRQILYLLVYVRSVDKHTDVQDSLCFFMCRFSIRSTSVCS